MPYVEKMRRYAGMLACGLVLLVGACASTTQEGVLSSGQKFATIEVTGNGLTPATTVVLLSDSDGKNFAPIAGGTGPGVIPSAISGAAGSVVAVALPIVAERRSGPAVVNNVEGSVAVAKSKSKTNNKIKVNPTMINDNTNSARSNSN